MLKYRPAIAHITAMLVLVLLAAGCGGTPAQSGTELQLKLLSLARFGETMTINATISSPYDVSDVEVVFTIPENIEVVNGQKQHRLSLEANKVQNFYLDIRLDQIGEQKIEITVINHLSPTDKLIEYKKLYLEVGKDHTDVRDSSVTPTPATEGIVTGIRIESFE